MPAGTVFRSVFFVLTIVFAIGIGPRILLQGPIATQLPLATWIIRVLQAYDLPLAARFSTAKPSMNDRQCQHLWNARLWADPL
jgi:hypothetical protein